MLAANQAITQGWRPLPSIIAVGVRTSWLVVALTSARQQGPPPAKTSRIELRATEDDRDLLDRVAVALGTDRSSFLLAQGRLAARHQLAGFHCRSEEQTAWLVQVARQAHGSGITRVFVVTEALRFDSRLR